MREEKDEERETYYLLKKREPNTYVGETTSGVGMEEAYSRNTSMLRRQKSAANRGPDGKIF